MLQLEDVRGQVVGDGVSRGISGGQRKRVNLGLELVAAPALLLLGKPVASMRADFVVVVGSSASTFLHVRLLCHLLVSEGDCGTCEKPDVQHFAQR